MRVAVLAGAIQYAHHLLPLWRALPKDQRGPFLVMGDALARSLLLQGVRARLWDGEIDMPLLVSSQSDLQRARRARAEAIAYVEHGCGQSYAGDRRTARHAAYAGGDGRDGCGIILAPNESAAARWRDRYPAVPVHVIGATRVLTPPEDSRRPTLALSWHWTGDRIPEMRNALPHYRSILPRLRETFRVIGHSHPRYAGSARAVFERAGIPFVDEIQEVAKIATVYAVDNSSTLWEMGLSRPVVALNAPWYRRDVEHGLRFWSHVPISVDDGPSLLAVAGRLLNGGETAEERERRDRICREVIPSLCGAQDGATLVARWAAAL